MRTILAIPGLILGFISLIIMLLGMIPFLGWLNWIGIPFAVIGLLFSLIGRSRTGTVMCVVIIMLGALRLQIGYGVI